MFASPSFAETSRNLPSFVVTKAIKYTDLAHSQGDLHGRRAASIEDVLRGWAIDELHDDLVLDQIDVVQDRHRDSGRSGFRHETRFVADARPAERIVERLETIRFRCAMLLDGGPSQELRSSELRLRTPLDEHAARCEAAEKNLSSSRPSGGR